MKENCFTKFKSLIDHYKLPERFTFPFYYEPHPLSVLAAEELQEHLRTQTEWEHNFGLEKDKSGMVIGKMFGVLVVQNQQGEIGYLSAFSGKLADSNHHSRFVPPVFDMLTEGSFFNIGIVELNAINDKIKTLENEPDYLACLQKIATDQQLSNEEIASAKKALKEKKAIRKKRRIEDKTTLSAAAYQQLEEALAQESQITKIRFKNLTNAWKTRLAENDNKLLPFTKEIDALKLERKTKSVALQQKLFHQYQFLNQAGERKNLLEIFRDKTPVAGSGECAAPKLLQYAFTQQRRKMSTIGILL